jgi:hypothetical protein
MFQSTSGDVFGSSPEGGADAQPQAGAPSIACVIIWMSAA